MKCPKCGAENSDYSNYCQACGSSLTAAEAGVAAVPVKTCGLAIAALVLGILSFFSCGLAIIPAIICGIIALVKISNSGGRLKGTAMAIIGIVLPVVAIPVMALLMALLMPAFAQMRHVAQKMVCRANLSMIEKAMTAYADDNKGEYPTPDQWCDLLIEHTDVTENVFICRGAHEGRCHYAMNIEAERLGINAPPDMVLIFESKPGWNQAGGAELLTTDNHRGDGCNVLFVDGHVEFVKPGGIPKLRFNAEDNP